MTPPVTPYRIRTTAGSQIILVQELRDAPRREFSAITSDEARALAHRLIFLANEVDREG